MCHFVCVCVFEICEFGKEKTIHTLEMPMTQNYILESIL